MIEQVRESSAQRAERRKSEKDGLDVIEDICSLAESGELADADTLDRLKWYGMYTHRTDESPDQQRYQQPFMLRVKVPGGRLSPKQLKTLADISQEFSRGLADITVRQTIEFHWIEMEYVPEIFKRLKAVGLTTQNASGDGLRSIVGCPLEGATDDEYCDVSELRTQINDFFQGNHDFSNLPRKYKIGISACTHHCMDHEIQDLGFTAFETAEKKILFDVTIGGGLGSNRRFARRLGCVRKGQIFDVCVAVGKMFRDHGNRENRQKARIGHLVEAWGVEKVRTFLEESQGFRFFQYPEPQITPAPGRMHLGVLSSKKPGTGHLGCVVLGGHLGCSGLRVLHDICVGNGASGVVLTSGKNCIVMDIPEERLAEVQEGMKEAGFDFAPSPFRTRSLACVGRSFCTSAVSETQQMEKELILYLEQRFPDFAEPLFISLSGCPHTCSHANIADLGFIGCKVKEDGVLKSGFSLSVGGGLQGETQSHFAQRTSLKVSSEKLCEFVESLLEAYRNDDSYSTFTLFMQHYALPYLAN